ncbi:hypothetical protein ACSSS7_001164 [Eimeria intestinalis]
MELAIAAAAGLTAPQAATGATGATAAPAPAAPAATAEAAAGGGGETWENSDEVRSPDSRISVERLHLNL